MAKTASCKQYRTPNALIRFDGAIGTFIQSLVGQVAGLPVKQLDAITRAAEALTTTNCWHALYDAQPFIFEAVRSEKARQTNLRRAMERLLVDRQLVRVAGGVTLTRGELAEITYQERDTDTCGTVEGYWTGDIDTWGKYTIQPFDGGPCLYLFSNEFVAYAPLLS